MSVEAKALRVDESGALPDGTPFRITLPVDWNGVLVRDLDYVSRRENEVSRPLYNDMLRRGYAVAGTMRHRLRMYQYDPVREIANLDRVLDLLTERSEKPGRVIQYGCSGGGHLTLAVAEDFPERVDGCVALAAHTPVWLMNTFLDGWFVLHTLIGPDYEAAGAGSRADLSIVGLENDGTVNPTGHGRGGALAAAWRKAVQIAQATPAGRARIALAFALGQWPAWVNEDTPQPDLADPPALQRSMFHALLQNSANPGGEARIMFENAANGQQLSWNDDVDYAAWLATANVHYQGAARALYQAAGLDLEDDLGTLARAPRVKGSPHALAFWGAAGRTTRGRPKIPVLRLHMVGDYQIPPSLVEGYEAEVQGQGTEDLYRSAYVNATGHCNFSVAESAAAIALVLRRLESSSWDSTDPAALNAFADELETGTAPRFMDYGPHRQVHYNRVWRP